MHRILLLAVMATLPHGLHSTRALAQSPDRPSVVVITTGGTIASRAGEASLAGEELVKAVPELLTYAEVTVEEFSRIGSSQMTPAHWLRLAQRINGIFRDPSNPAGIVVTHGTDTMEETAFFLNLTVRDPRPVVVVGSMRPATAVSADGPANLLSAVRVAVAPSARNKGVLIVLNDEISSARDAWKTNNRRLQTFEAPGLGFLGVTDPDTLVFYRSPMRRHTVRSEFDVAALTELPTVPVVIDYAGADGSAISSWASRKVDGLVIMAFADGRMSAGARRGVADVVGRGIPVAIASRVPNGRIIGDPIDLPVVVARDLPAHKARVLLMLALTETTDVVQIQHMFDEY